MDIADSTYTFSHTVTKLLPTNQEIQHSIYALAALHEAQFEKQHMLDRARGYYNHAIGDLYESIAAKKEPLVTLACTIILRVYQEMSTDFQAMETLHLAGAIAILRHKRATSSIWRMSFWAALRQDLCAALKTGQRLRHDMIEIAQEMAMDINAADVDDTALTNEMTRLLAYTIDTVNGVVSKDAIQNLQDKIESWYNGLPISFACILDDGEMHGRLSYLEPWHTLGAASYHFATALLLANDRNGLRTFHCLRTVRAARFERHIGVRVHLLAMFDLCHQMIDSHHKDFVIETAAIVSRHAGFPMTMSMALR